VAAVAELGSLDAVKADNKSKLCGLLFAAMFFALGLTSLFQAHYADVHHTTIWHGPDGAIREPWQGYVGAAVCFVATAFIATSALRAPPHDDI
jgi:hypothetical protein